MLAPKPSKRRPFYRRRLRRPRGRGMTVAIAAMSGFPNDVVIIGAEDRMVTAGDINFDRPQAKIFQLHDSCAAMIFGLSAAQSEVVESTRVHVREKKVTSISAIAEIYSRYLRS